MTTLSEDKAERALFAPSGSSPSVRLTDGRRRRRERRPGKRDREREVVGAEKKEEVEGPPMLRLHHHNSCSPANRKRDGDKTGENIGRDSCRTKMGRGGDGERER